MKNVIKKIILITLSISGILTQIGCGSWGEDKHPVTRCEPDHVSIKTNSETRKYNGLEITGDYNIGFSDELYEVEIKDASISKLSDTYKISPSGTDFDHHYEIKNFPIQQDDDGTFPLQVIIDGNYFSLENVSSGNHVQIFEPLSDVYNYQGWEDDTRAIFQFGYYTNGYGDDHQVEKIQLNVTDTLAPAFSLESVMELQRPIVENSPDLSPNGQLQITIEKHRTWTGELTAKVLQNSKSHYIVEKTVTLSDGNNMFEQVNTTDYAIEPAGCYEYYVY